ncbi:hypothetical protein CASFOL_033487 [Castilleja foliolosa]|uniref:Uncharacterized protein n=1 Tax=Castilleja foliolosa TaxID=1961234 RepID=A0ABD3BYU1_9LAMI
METPSSSTRRVTRSQTSANNSNLLYPRKIEESEKTITMKSRRRSDQSALIDITNDSPIVGLAKGNLKTPSSAMSKKKRMGSRTPDSGEALLRGQVKTLLQKVEEEADNRPFFIKLQGPVNLVAPTPANTPQILNLDATCLPWLTPSPVEDKFIIPQMISEMMDEKKKKEWETESENLVTRSLLLDFSSDSVNESSLDDDDDDESVWSIQVNVSSTRDEEEEGDIINDGGVVVDELCEGMSKISVGKHIRFVYNSDDEIEETENECVYG